MIKMAVYDKIQRSLLGKCCLPSQGIALTQALQSISGKVPCPSGEQIVNGGFEDALNHWDYFLAWLYGHGHSGVEACELYYIDGWIEQTLETEIAVNCVDIFECWVHPAGTVEDPNNFRLIVTYTDDSTSTHVFDDLVFSVEWQHLNLKPYLTSGKTIQKIKFIEESGTSYIAVDDVSLIC